MRCSVRRATPDRDDGEGSKGHWVNLLPVAGAAVVLLFLHATLGGRHPWARPRMKQWRDLILPVAAAAVLFALWIALRSVIDLILIARDATR